jgi:hypothetical protein
MEHGQEMLKELTLGATLITDGASSAAKVDGAMDKIAHMSNRKEWLSMNKTSAGLG